MGFTRARGGGLVGVSGGFGTVEDRTTASSSKVQAIAGRHCQVSLDALLHAIWFDALPAKGLTEAQVGARRLNDGRCEGLCLHIGEDSVRFVCAHI